MSDNRLRCQHETQKGERTAICGRYLGDIGEDRVYVRCPKCGGFTTIEARDTNVEAIKNPITIEQLEEALQSLRKSKIKENE